MSAQRVLDAIEKLEQVLHLLDEMRESVVGGICDTVDPQGAATSLKRRLSRLESLVSEALEKIGD